MQFCIRIKKDDASVNFSNILGDGDINITDMTNKSRGDYAYSLLDLESNVTEEIVGQLASIRRRIKSTESSNNKARTNGGTNGSHSTILFRFAQAKKKQIKIAALPYDVYNREEAKAAVANHP